MLRPWAGTLQRVTIIGENIVPPYPQLGIRFDAVRYLQCTWTGAGTLEAFWSVSGPLSDGTAGRQSDAPTEDPTPVCPEGRSAGERSAAVNVETIDLGVLERLANCQLSFLILSAPQTGALTFEILPDAPARLNALLGPRVAVLDVMMEHVTDPTIQTPAP